VTTAKIDASVATIGSVSSSARQTSIFGAAVCESPSTMT
jgi:hypothetical protein